MVPPAQSCMQFQGTDVHRHTHFKILHKTRHVAVVLCRYKHITLQLLLFQYIAVAFQEGSLRNESSNKSIAECHYGNIIGID